MYKELAFSILLQAIEDYKMLQEFDASELRIDSDVVSKDELEDFFTSEWCDSLLSAISGLTGESILKMLQE